MKERTAKKQDTARHHEDGLNMEALEQHVSELKDHLMTSERFS